MSSPSNFFRQFKSLSLYEKLHFVHQRAVCLKVSCITATTEADLFGCDGFYIEVIVNRANMVVLEVKAFRSMARLKPYLSQIDISDVAVLLSLRT